MTEKKRTWDTLQEMLRDQVIKNGQALVADQLLWLTFPRGPLEADIFCAVHGFSRTTSKPLYIFNDPFPDAIVEKQK